MKIDQEGKFLSTAAPVKGKTGFETAICIRTKTYNVLYLTPEQSRELARDLLAKADECERVNHGG